jgi:hypothetical protein
MTGFPFIDALEAYQAGKITLWQAAQRCNISLWEMIREAKQRHIHASYDMQELEKDLAALWISGRWLLLIVHKIALAWIPTKA